MSWLSEEEEAPGGGPAEGMHNFDVFPKTRSELSERTLTGALILLVSILLIGLAAIGEMRDCMRVVTVVEPVHSHGDEATRSP